PQNSYRIVLGNLNFIKNLGAKLTNDEIIPTIISVNSQWKGTLQTFQNEKLFKNFIDSLNDGNADNTDNNTGSNSPAFLANAFSATLCTVEYVKLCLCIGNTKKDMLYFDLFNMEFNQTESNINLSEFLDESYGIEKLSDAKVLIVGVGGLGSPAAYGMTIADVNTLGLLDLDEVEISNLNRQILHSFSRIGMPKASSAEFLLKNINPNINIRTHTTELTKDNAEDIFSEYDLIIAAVDNIPTRYLINDTCFLIDKPFSEAGVLRFDGTATTIVPHEGHCYRCLYPNVDGGNLSGDNGVLGAVPGAMGFIQAAEAVKILLGLGKTLKNKILLFDSLEMDFNIIDIGRNPQCPTCSGK
ncbi:MAG: HesA/MoeB/ThiF family protein, partial [Tissierellia bacterium]|nr:HesA/MoeB/ThiF family protein [Tissierellia bacterium]